MRNDDDQEGEKIELPFQICSGNMRGWRNKTKNEEFEIVRLINLDGHDDASRLVSGFMGILHFGKVLSDFRQIFVSNLNWDDDGELVIFVANSGCHCGDLLGNFDNFSISFCSSHEIFWQTLDGSRFDFSLLLLISQFPNKFNEQLLRMGHERK